MAKVNGKAGWAAVILALVIALGTAITTLTTVRAATIENAQDIRDARDDRAEMRKAIHRIDKGIVEIKTLIKKEDGQ